MEELTIRNKYRVISGKDFKCAACGVCCKLYSLADLHITDLFRISERLGISPKEFFTQYCKVIKNDADTWTFGMDIEGGCRFQSGNKCGIYEARADMCAFYPNSHTCFDLSRVQKAELKKANPTCIVHKLDDNLILVPDLERMVDSRIFYMIKEMYLARYGSDFDEEGAKMYHQKGLAQVNNQKMREIVHRQIMNEVVQNLPLDEETNEPILTRDEVAMIYKKMREH
jgi:Fe-S-cluster containining protein